MSLAGPLGTLPALVASDRYSKTGKSSAVFTATRHRSGYSLAPISASRRALRRLDYSYSTGTIIRGAILGVPVRNLTFDFSRVLHALMSRPDIPNAAALRGKRVGVSSFGATGDLAARVGLRSLGLDPEKDVTIITLGTDTLRHAALLAGTVQATHMPVPSHPSQKRAIMNWFYLENFSSDYFRQNPQKSRPVRAWCAPSLPPPSPYSGTGRFISCAQKNMFTPRCHEELQISFDSLPKRFVEDSSLQPPSRTKTLAKITKSIPQVRHCRLHFCVRRLETVPSYCVCDSLRDVSPCVELFRKTRQNNTA